MQEDHIEKLEKLSMRVSALEASQMAHMSQTADIKSDTAELIATFRALKGAWSVLDFIGKAAKPLAIVGAMCTSIWYFISQRK